MMLVSVLELHFDILVPPPEYKGIIHQLFGSHYRPVAGQVVPYIIPHTRSRSLFVLMQDAHIDSVADEDVLAFVSDQSEELSVCAYTIDTLPTDRIDALSHFTSGTLAELCECFGFGICEEGIRSE
jgi:hypothetical protein